MRNVSGHDLGDLRKSKMSEVASEVRCHNHAYQVALQRQLNQWHKEQVVAVNKLSKMQQRSFQNLIRVENEKRKLQRRARIKKQKNIQQKLREQAAREREDAMRRSLDLKLTIQGERKKRQRTNGMAFPLPTNVQTIEEESSRVDGEEEGGVQYNDRRWERGDGDSYAGQTENGPVGSSRESGNQDGRSSKFINNNYLPSIESSQRQSIDDAISLAQSRTDSTEKTALTKTDNSVYIRTATELPDIEMRSLSVKPVTEEIQPTQTKTVLPPINSSSREETFKGDSGVDDASASSFSRKTKERMNDKAKQKEQDITIDDFHKYHIGIANRSFKIPEYEPPVVTSVTKYHRNADGSFTSTDVSVRPAKEDFKLPSRKPYYLISKALGWEKQRETERERKVRQFIARHKEIEDGKNNTSERKDILSTPEMPPQNGYQRTRKQSTYITLNDSIHHKALLGVLGDKEDLRNCRYLRTRDGMDNTEDELQGETEARSGRTMSSTKRREKLSSWGKLSAVKAPPHKKEQYYYVSLL